jgi:hypothetical protein
MRIDYGPPGHKGVTQIMGLGDAATEYTGSSVAASKAAVPQDRSGRVVGGLAAATWLLGAIMGSRTTKHLAMGGLVAVVASQMLKNQRPSAPVAPTSTQGWG